MNRFSLKAVKAFVLAGIVSGVVVGCNEANNPVVDSFTVSDKNSSAALSQKNSELVNAMQQGEQNLQMAALAKAVAATLAENNTAKALHQQAMRKFDGCTEVLWNALNTDQTMSNSLGANSWSLAVSRNANKFSLQAGEINSLLEQYSKHYAANTHLYWYNAEKWDGKTSPLVTFVPVLAKGQDIDKMPGEVVAYDANGKEFIVNEATAKTRPVIVIAPNERTEMNGQLKQSVAENLNAPRTSRPKDGKSLQNSFMSLTHLSFDNAFEGTWFIEHWILGDPEFYALIHTIGTSNASFVYQWARWDFTGSITRGQCNGQFFSVFRGGSWNSSQEKTLNFKWFEFDDSNVTTELSLGASFKIDTNTSVNASYKVTIKDQDDVLGGMTAHFDDAWKIYYAGNPNMMLNW